MPGMTKAELERSNALYRDRLAEIYDEIGDLLGVDDADGDEEDEEDDEAEED